MGFVSSSFFPPHPFPNSPGFFPFGSQPLCWLEPGHTPFLSQSLIGAQGWGPEKNHVHGRGLPTLLPWDPEPLPPLPCCPLGLWAVASLKLQLPANQDQVTRAPSVPEPSGHGGTWVSLSPLRA